MGFDSADGMMRSIHFERTKHSATEGLEVNRTAPMSSHTSSTLSVMQERRPPQGTLVSAQLAASEQPLGPEPDLYVLSLTRGRGVSVSSTAEEEIPAGGGGDAFKDQ